MRPRYQTTEREPVPVTRANSAGFDFTPEVSPDGRWLYLSSTRAVGTQSDLYRVPLRSVLP